MKTFVLLAAVALCLPTLTACESGSTSHTVTAHKTLLGGEKVTDTTVHDNGNGNVSMDKKTTTVNP
ncbi:MAG TPA: hypothetical protein VHQ47_11930 [Phycisphaerae bacterium]|jgi:hypothetical protein|nr:hypothetical protein [Phycisphaerae bacterium]